jgi:uncharacterized repeat protein (TIGR02543 family)
LIYQVLLHLLYRNATIYVRVKGDDNHNPSEAEAITLPKRPAAPTDLVVTGETYRDQGNGSITGVDSNMEYKLSTVSSWTAITETSVSELDAGVYSVRYKATDSSFAGVIAPVAVSQGNTLTITFDSNGGSCVGNIEGLSYDAATGTLPSPARPGYTFSGWYREGVQLTADTQITAYVTCTARWTANSYTLAFSANGGTGSIDGMRFTYDQAQALTQNSFTRQGFYFSGWSLTQDGVVVYGDEQSVKNLTAVNGGTATLYAQWNRNPTYAVSGAVTNGAGADISLSKGSTAVSQSTCDEEGEFNISGVVPGSYNIVATSEDGKKTVTSLVTVSNEDVSGLTLTLPDLDFSDTDQISNYASDAVLWACESEIIQGKGNNLLDPKGRTLRSEAAQMLMKFFNP